MNTSASAIVSEYSRKRGAYEGLAEEVEALLRKLTKAASIRCHSIASRTKSVESLAEKVVRPGKAYTKLDDITDLAGIRVITFFADDVDRVSTLIDKEFRVDAGRSIDKRVHEPTQFGYSSLHKVCGISDERARLAEFGSCRGLMCEIQVRSILQHAWAEIEHDLGYKSADSVPTPARRRFSRLAAILDMADDELAGLRAQLVDYAGAAERTVDQKEALEINNDSLEAFIRRDRTVPEIDSIVAHVMRAKLVDPVRLDVESRVRELKRLGIRDTTELANRLKANRTAIEGIARAMTHRARRRSHSRVSRGVSISWLGLAIAAGLAESTDTAGLLAELRIADPDQAVTQTIRAAVRETTPQTVSKRRPARN